MKRNLVAIGSCFNAPRLYEDMFDGSIRIGFDPNPDEIRKKINKGDVILFGGGEDISPKLYGEKSVYMTFADGMSVRDLTEKIAFEVARSQGAKCYGICRGAQILCALSGGKLVQHVSGHGGGGHFISTRDKERYFTSSAHHQMMWPYGLAKDRYEMIAVSEKNLSNVYMFSPKDIRKEIEHPEPEIVYFPETHSLGIQGHPEFMRDDADFVGYSRRLLEQYLLKGE